MMEIIFGTKTMFTRSDITPLKVNRFGWTLEHWEHIIGGSPWHILGAIRAIATVWDAADFTDFPSEKNSRNLSTTTSISLAVKARRTTSDSAALTVCDVVKRSSSCQSSAMPITLEHSQHQCLRCRFARTVSASLLCQVDYDTVPYYFSLLLLSSQHIYLFIFTARR